MDICYPKEHSDLMKKIIENGAVISQYPPGIKPQTAYFPERNRIISAWSYKRLVVEAGEKSGALITAEIAKEQEKQVLAVPNGIYQSESMGTNRLIYEGTGVYLKPMQLLVNISLNLYDDKENEEFIVESMQGNISDTVERDIVAKLKDKPLTIEELLNSINICECQ